MPNPETIEEASGRAKDRDEQAQLSIDEEIGSLESALLSLKSRRNSHSKICQLPADVLTQIFAKFDPAQRNFHCSDFSSMLWFWYTVTHVCRVWREAALECPSLWSYINTRRPEEARSFLVRSKAALLDVCIDTRAPAATRNSADHTPRSIPDELMSHVATTIQAESKRIRHLEVIFAHSGNVSWDEWRHLSGWWMWGKDNLLRLKSLKIVEFVFPWSLSGLRGLTTLEVAFLSSTPRVDDVLGILRGCPGLETLRWDASGPLPDVAGTPKTTKVELPRLRNMTILNLESEPWAETLSRLVLPVLHSWYISTYDHPMDGSLSRFIIPPFYPAELSHFQCRTLKIDMHDMDKVSISADICQSPSSNEIIQRLVLTGERGYARGMQETVRIIQPVWMKTKALKICLGSSEPGRMEGSLRALLQKFANVTELTITNRSPSRRDTQIETMCANILREQQLGDEGGGVICPELNCLRLEEFNLDRQRGDGLGSFLRALHARAKHAPLGRLELNNCKGISLAIVAELREVATEVDLIGWS